MQRNGWSSVVEVRDNRYNQIIHMVSAANGAEEFYSLEVSRRRRCTRRPNAVEWTGKGCRVNGDACGVWGYVCTVGLGVECEDV